MIPPLEKGGPPGTASVQSSSLVDTETVWEIDNADTIGKVTSHSGYHAVVRERDRLHNMARRTMILATTHDDQ